MAKRKSVSLLFCHTTYCSSSLELMLGSLRVVTNVLKINYLPQGSTLRAHYKKLTLNTV